MTRLHYDKIEVLKRTIRIINIMADKKTLLRIELISFGFIEEKSFDRY